MDLCGSKVSLALAGCQSHVRAGLGFGAAGHHRSASLTHTIAREEC
jgi:hypothetical protein